MPILAPLSHLILPIPLDLVPSIHHYSAWFTNDLDTVILPGPALCPHSLVPAHPQAALSSPAALHWPSGSLPFAPPTLTWPLLKTTPPSSAH